MPMVQETPAGLNVSTGEASGTQITCNFPAPPATPHHRRDSPLIYMELDPQSNYGFDENYNLMKKCIRCQEKPWWSITEFRKSDGERDMCRFCTLESAYSSGKAGRRTRNEDL